jgi:hypothetical protein
MGLRGFVLGLLLLLIATDAAAQNYAMQGLDHYFRLEWEKSTSRRGPVLAGYIYNISPLSADRVRLGIDRVDAGGQVVESTIGYVLGTVPSGNRAYFEIPVRDAASYKVRVLSYEPIGRGL